MAIHWYDYFFLKLTSFEIKVRNFIIQFHKPKSEDTIVKDKGRNLNSPWTRSESEIAGMMESEHFRDPKSIWTQNQEIDEKKKRKKVV